MKLMSFGCAAGILACAVAAAEARTNLVIGIGQGPNTAMYRATAEFARLTSEYTDGNVTLDIQHSGALGDDVEMLESTRFGLQDATVVSTAPATNFVGSLKIFDLPFLFADTGRVDCFIDGEMGARLLGGFETVDLKGLSFWENGFRNVSNNVRPVVEPADVSGLKIRTLESPMHLALWETLGANPTPMAWGEVIPALRQGVIDGQENAWWVLDDLKVFEVQKYGTDTGHVYQPLVVVFSQAAWSGLAADEQQAVTRAAAEAQAFNREEMRSQDAEHLAALKGKVDITILTPEQREKWVEAVAPVYDRFADEIGADLVADARTTLAACGE